MPYRIDQTHFSTKSFRYESFGKYEFQCNISGTLANNFYKQFQLNIQFTDSRVQARAFIQNAAGLSAPLTAGQVIPNYSPSYEIYDWAGAEDVYTDQHFEDDGEYYVVNLLIYNTSGGPINLVTQTVTIFVEFYEAPLEWAT